MPNENTTMRITELKAQIDDAAYRVDVDAVAEVFVSRMLAVHGALLRPDVRALLGDAALGRDRQLPPDSFVLRPAQRMAPRAGPGPNSPRRPRPHRST